jgi:hypothetical protein
LPGSDLSVFIGRKVNSTYQENIYCIALAYKTS